MRDWREVASYKFSASLSASDFESYEKARLTIQDRLVVFFVWIGTSVCALVVIGLVNVATGEKTLGIASGVAFWILLSLGFRSMKKSRYVKAASEHVPYDLIVDRIGVTQKIGRTETKYSWSEIDDVEKAGDAIEIRTWEGAVYLIPKHCFEDEAQYESCFQFASDMRSSVPVGHA